MRSSKHLSYGELLLFVSLKGMAFLVWFFIEKCACIFFTVSLGVMTINETIDKGDSADLLLALKHKNVALRSVTPECAQQYRDELKKAKDLKEDPSMFLYAMSLKQRRCLQIISPV